MIDMSVRNNDQADLPFQLRTLTKTALTDKSPAAIGSQCIMPSRPSRLSKPNLDMFLLPHHPVHQRSA
jgi:hypothetical protein